MVMLITQMIVVMKIQLLFNIKNIEQNIELILLKDNSVKQNKSKNE